MSKKNESVNQNKSTFLVTGGAGFIGSNICEKLIQLGHNVICLDNLSNGKIENLKEVIESDRFTLIIDDIRKLETCISASKNVDYILHQAALGSVPRSIEMPLIYEDVNVKGTLNIFEAARINKVKKVIYASSSSVYGDEENLPKIEEKVGNVISPYALTKKINEEYAKLYINLYGLKLIGLRYFNVFGKNQNPNGQYAAVIPKFTAQITNNIQPIINGDGEQSRDFTHVDNVVYANISSCFSDIKSTDSVFNIASGGRITLNQLYKKISELVGKNIKPIHGPVRLGDIEHSYASIEKAIDKLKYKVITPFETGLKSYIEWYLLNSSVED